MLIRAGLSLRRRHGVPIDALTPSGYRPSRTGDTIGRFRGVALMRRACAGPGARLSGLLLALLTGCFSVPSGQPNKLVESLKPSAGPRGADAIVLEVALLEQPLGDRYLNEGLWSAADEQAIDMDRKAALDDNGFRIGLVGGIPPAELLNLLTSE